MSMTFKEATTIMLDEVDSVIEDLLSGTEDGLYDTNQKRIEDLIKAVEVVRSFNTRPKKYLLIVVGDVEPVIQGPYKSEDSRGRAAIKHRKADPDMYDGIFKLNATGEISVDSYSGGFFFDH